MTTRLVPPNWSLQPFERRLAALEAERLVGRRGGVAADGIYFPDPIASATLDALLKRLSFTQAVETSSGRSETLQSQFERAAGGGTRKVTSHTLHGLHPYKGKFYPQLARSLINVCGVREGSVVLDPFAGCGTSVIEATLLGMRGLGIDANPMAVLVAKTKLELLSCPADVIRLQFSRLTRLPFATRPLPDEPYLQRWFPSRNFEFLRRAIEGIAALDLPVAKSAALVALSSVLRSASLQDPKQLRVRRRAHDAVLDLDALFYGALADLVAELTAVQSIDGFDWQALSSRRSQVLEGDARETADVLRRHDCGTVDAVITSPPYASALPYIDTDRLSLRAFGMLTDGSQRLAESQQIGNREIAERDRIAIEDQLHTGSGLPPWVPIDLREVLKATFEVARNPESGFRKRRTPALLFMYFRDMRVVFEQLGHVLRDGGPAVVVVGDNVVAGPNGGTVVVPTADILVEIASGLGLQLEEDLTKRLTSYGASDTVHQRNAMESERILLFRRKAPGIRRDGRSNRESHAASTDKGRRGAA